MKPEHMKEELEAAQEVIGALQRRIFLLEGGERQSHFQEQLKAYQQRIKEEAAKLKEVQEWSRLLVENAMDAIVGIDDCGKITHWNPRAELMFGWEENEAIGKPLIEILFPEGLKDGYAGAVNRYLTDGKNHSPHSPMEVMVLLKDGSNIVVELAVSTLKRESSNFFVVILRDISERKQAEVVLKNANENLARLVEEGSIEIKRSEERFALAMRGANDGLWDWNLETDEVYYSPRWKSMLGYNEDELEASIDTWGMLVHPDEKDSVLQKVQDYMKGRRHSFEIEMRMAHKKGGWIDVLSRGFMVWNEDNEKPVRLVGTHVDITERKRGEEERRRLASIVELTSDYVALTNASGDLVYMNSGGRKMVGLPEDCNINEMNISDFHSEQESQRIIQTLLPQTVSGQALEIECLLLHSDGHEVPTSAVFMSFGKDSKIPEYYAIVARDLSRERALQREMEHVDRLESLGVLAGGIAHDFNNILTSIVGNADLAKRKLDPTSRMSDLIGRIEASSAKAADLCQQMLAYAGKGKFVIQAINLSEVVGDMLSLMEISISKGVKLRLNLDENIPHFEGDVTQIRQVIINLLTNASEAMDRNEKIISITTGVRDFDLSKENVLVSQPENDNGRYVFLEVADTGHGMDEETMRKVFDPFFTTKFTGRGLGMSAVIGIVNGHLGVMKLRSEVGVGTTFTIGFPVMKSETKVVDEAVVPATDIVSGMEKSMGGSPVKKSSVEKFPAEKTLGTILFIDDEEEIREMAEILLQEMGCDVLLASDGKEGVELFAQYKQEIVGVILDMTMPVMGGKTCCAELQKIDADVKVILISGYSKDETVRDFDERKLAGFIHKPFQVDDFKNTVHKIF